jgi:Na+-transporting NADH:ubiquinone oxidoreductase subunit C
MSKKGNESLTTIIVAGALCLVCSLLVSFTVVSLKEKQTKNKELDFKKNVLMSAGLIEPGVSAEVVESTFSKIKTIIVDFESGEVTTKVDPKNYDQNKAASNPEMNVRIPSGEDVASLNTRAKYAEIYLVQSEGGEIEKVILPVKGKGLWSTMYGFLALGSDTNTIKGFAYYSHGETPGLGGEVDNPKWKSQWIGKKVYNDNWDVQFKVAKGSVNSGSDNAIYQVDGLSGATITGNGVTSSMDYWFGSHGYKKFLENVREGRI